MSTQAASWHRKVSDPANLDRGRPEQLALITLYVLAAATPLWSVALAQLSQVVLLGVAGYVLLHHRQQILSHPLLWLTCFYVLYVALRGWVAAAEQPALSFEHWEGTRRWIKAGLLPSLLVMLAFWLSCGRERHIVGLLATLLLGLTTKLLFNLDATAFVAAIGGEDRYAFDLMLAFSSLLFGMALLGLLIFFPRVIRATRGHRLQCAVVVLAWSALAMFFCAALVASGTRAAWVGTVAAAITAGVVWTLRWRQLGIGRREAVAALSAVVVVAVLATAWFAPRISGRITPALDAMASGIHLVTGNVALEDVPRDPLGIRIAYNAYGLEKFAERPLFGYGPADPIHLNSGEQVPYQIKGRNDHFHNTSLEALLRLGIVGTIPLFVWFGLAFFGVHRGWRDERLAPSTGLFLIAFMVGYGVWSLADVRFGNYSVIGHLAIVTGVACSFLLAPRQSSQPPAGPSDGEPIR